MPLIQVNPTEDPKKGPSALETASKYLGIGVNLANSAANLKTAFGDKSAQLQTNDPNKKIFLDWRNRGQSLD